MVFGMRPTGMIGEIFPKVSFIQIELEVINLSQIIDNTTVYDNQWPLGKMGDL